MANIYGCCLYMDFYGILFLKEVFLEKETDIFALHRHTVRDFWLEKPNPIMRTLSFYEEILRVFSNVQTFSVIVDTVMLCPM